MNKLIKATDIIDFGCQKGTQFFWIYRMHTSYLEWLIKETDYCFSNLAEFYTYGKIKRIHENISIDKKELIIKEVKKNPTINNSTNVWLMNVHNLDHLILDGVLVENDFVELDYNFNNDLILKNEEKLNFCKPYNKLTHIKSKKYSHNFFYI